MFYTEYGDISTEVQSFISLSFANNYYIKKLANVVHQGKKSPRSCCVRYHGYHVMNTGFPSLDRMWDRFLKGSQPKDWFNSFLVLCFKWYCLSIIWYIYTQYSGCFALLSHHKQSRPEVVWNWSKTPSFQAVFKRGVLIGVSLTAFTPST